MTELDELIAGTLRELQGPLHQVEWAEQEIEAARKRHPEADQRIWDSFSLLPSTHPLMETDFVFRSHARELLERVAAGEDTRPGTWAEIVCVCHDVAIKVPLNGVAFGLYCRAWVNAFPDMPALSTVDRSHYEAIHASEIDDYESDTRRKLAVASRRLTVKAEPAKYHSTFCAVYTLNGHGLPKRCDCGYVKR